MEDMELVIRMPEKIYKHILSMQFYIPGLRSGKSLLEEILKAIRTGTPLPKGHGRLIDADAILEEPFGNTYKDIDIAETIVEADKKQEDNGFFDEIMDDESEDEETYEKIKEIMEKVKEQE